jgi:radical SAM superfamily enzyme YgiQ (UPF0313 family)
MNVLLVSANTETVNMVPLPLGLNCVAVAARSAGHNVRLLDLMGTGDHARTIQNAVSTMKPDLIGVSVRNVDNQRMLEPRFLLEPVREIIALCRNVGTVPIVVGGAGFSIFPQAVLRYLKADLGMCGEGEAAFVALLTALERGDDLSGIAGICFPDGRVVRKTAGHTGLASLPFPDPSLWSVPAGAGADIWIPFQTRRGCPLKCSYCSTPALEGTAIRTHPVASVITALERHVAAGFNRFYFVDNTFNLPPRYAKVLCRAIISAGLGIQWRCILYPGFVNEETVRLMAEAGCVEISLGFESGCPDILRNLNKKFTVEQVRATAALFKQYGIRRNGFLLLGGPGETRETVLESLAFADSLDLDLLKLTMGIRIYPETPLAQIALAEGQITAGDDLLSPRFYLARELEDWLETTLNAWMTERPYCTT